LSFATDQTMIVGYINIAYQSHQSKTFEHRRLSYTLKKPHNLHIVIQRMHKKRRFELFGSSEWWRVHRVVPKFFDLTIGSFIWNEVVKTAGRF